MMSHFVPSRFLIRQAIRRTRIQPCLRSPLTIKDHLSSTKQINRFQSQFFSNDTQSKKDTADSPNASKKDETADEETDDSNVGVESKGLADTEIARLEEEVKSLKDQLMRSLAEQENTRRIAKRDVANAKQYAIKSFSKSLLDSSDNLERALDAVPEDLRTDSENHPVLVTLYEGIKMTEAGLNKAFEMNGLKKFGEVGENFDPNMHEALFEYGDPNREAGTVGQIMKSGFTLNDRVLRPAEVGVVKKEG